MTFGHHQEPKHVVHEGRRSERIAHSAILLSVNWPAIVARIVVLAVLLVAVAVTVMSYYALGWFGTVGLCAVLFAAAVLTYRFEIVSYLLLAACVLVAIIMVGWLVKPAVRYVIDAWGFVGGLGILLLLGTSIGVVWLIERHQERRKPHRLPPGRSTTE